MTPSAAAILEGMPDARILHRVDRDETTWIMAGPVVLACYPAGDAGMRNVAVAVCRQLGFGGRAVAAVFGLTGNYVATLHNRALREGTAGLVRAQGRPRKLAGGGPEDEPAAPQPEPGLQAGEPEPEAETTAPGPQAPEPEAVPAPPGPGSSPAGGLAGAGGREPAARPGTGLARIAGGPAPSRYAGAMP